MQAERIRCQRCRSDNLFALQGRRARITRQGSPSAQVFVFEQGQQARRLLGDRDAVVFTNGDCARRRIGSTSGSKGVSGSTNVEITSPGVPRETRR